MLAFVQKSTARQVRVTVNRTGQMLAGTLVIVPTMVIVTFVPSQLSTADGGVKFSGAPHSKVKLVPHVSTGGVVSMTVIVSVQVLALVQRSVALHVRVTVKRVGQRLAGTLVTVLTTVIDTLVPSQASTALGGGNTSGAPHWTVKFVPQLITGGVVSTKVMMFVQVFEFPQ